MPIPPAAPAPRRLTTTAALLVVLSAAVPVTLALAPPLAAQQRVGVTQSGPLIQSAGQSVEVDDATFMIPEGHVFKAVYVIDRADTTGSNQQLTTSTRGEVTRLLIGLQAAARARPCFPLDR